MVHPCVRIYKLLNIRFVSIKCARCVNHICSVYQKHEFKMEMSCEGCSNAAKRVLAKIGVTEVEADLGAQKLFVVSDKPHDELLTTLQKTGKKVEYIGISN